MLYELRIRARNDVRVPIENRHRALCKALKKLSRSWKGMKPLPIVSSENIDELVSVSLTRMLPRVKQALAVYTNRESDEDHGSNDDFVAISFRPDKLDYGFIAQQVFPQLLAPFGAYIGCILAEDVLLADYEKGLKNSREFVQRISPTCYFDRLLCRRAFGLTLKDVKQRLADEVEKVEIVNDGVLIIATVEAPDIDATEAIHKRLTKCLKSPPKGRRK